MSKLVDYNGLLYFWQGIKTRLNTKVDKVEGKGLSANDYTTTEKNKLAGIESEANKYVHPTYTARETGLYKVAVDTTGHVSSVTPVVKNDITSLGIPGEAGPTYSNASQSSAGLMSEIDKTNLDNLVSASVNYATTDDVVTAISNSQHMTKQIVQTLPEVANASDTVIYLVPKSGGSGNQSYNEYILISNTFEKIGDTETIIETVTNSEIDTILSS